MNIVKLLFFVCLAIRFSTPSVAQTSYAPAAPNAGRPNPAYILGSGDEINVWVGQLEQLAGRSFVVDRDGNVTLPLAGRIYVLGSTVEQAENLLRKALSVYLRDPDVAISLAQTRNEAISVTGAVLHPGVYQLGQGKTVMEMLLAAGGIQSTAGPWAVIMRPLTSGQLPLTNAHDDPNGKYSIAELNVRSLVSLQSSVDNIPLIAGDSIAVPEARSIFVVGDVGKPGAFPLNDEQQATALQVLAMAGGPLRTAAPEKARVLRNSHTGQKPTLISVNLKHLMKGKSPDLQLEPNDILFVPNSTEKAAISRAMDAAISTGLFALTYGVIYGK